MQDKNEKCYGSQNQVQKFALLQIHEVVMVVQRSLFPNQFLILFSIWVIACI